MITTSMRVFIPVFAFFAFTACQQETPITQIPADATPITLPSISIQAGQLNADADFVDAVRTPAGDVFAKINVDGDRCQTRGGMVTGKQQGDTLTFTAALQNCPGDFEGVVNVNSGDGEGTVANFQVVLSRR